MKIVFCLLKEYESLCMDMNINENVKEKHPDSPSFSF